MTNVSVPNSPTQQTPPLVSVIIPCFNSESFLADALESALSQTLMSKEVIVVDDGSTDDSAKILAAYSDRVRVFSQSNQGAAAARNHGIREAKGKYICFLDSDDFWDHRFLEKMTAAAEREQVKVVYCGWQNVGNCRNSKPFVPPNYQQMPDRWEKLFESTRWPIHAAMVERKLAIAAGMFDVARLNCEDFSFWLRTALDQPLGYVPEALAYYRFHDQGQKSSPRAKVLIRHFEIQMDFIRQHPERLGGHSPRQLRPLTLGYLMRRGFDAYWQHDLKTARASFRMVMRHGYGGWRDWCYMLPSLLPLSWHQALLSRWRTKHVQPD